MSTSIPTPSASPPREIRFILKSAKYISAKVVTIDTGIAIPTIKVDLIFLKNKKRIIIAKRPPPTALEATLLIDLLINSL